MRVLYNRLLKQFHPSLTCTSTVHYDTEIFYWLSYFDNLLAHIHNYVIVNFIYVYTETEANDLLSGRYVNPVPMEILESLAHQHNLSISLPKRGLEEHTDKQEVDITLHKQPDIQITYYQ